jgi:hypothetical protein
LQKEGEDYSPSSSTQEASQVVIVAPFTCKKMKGKEPLINYNISHVVTFEKYLNIM